MHFEVHMLRRFFLGAIAVMALVGGTAAFGQEQPGHHDGYVGSKACAPCHAEQHAAWAKSHHANAWNIPDGASVLGDFSGATFTHNGVETHFIRKLEDYLISTEGADGKTHEYKVQYTAGITPLQQYLIETEPGRLQAFDVAWDVKAKRWYHLFPELKITASDGLHWTGPYKNWNGRCAECHATDFKKNYEARTRKFASTQSEIGVGCEACHGPGSRHVDWAGRANKPTSQSGTTDQKDTDKGLLIKLATTSAKTLIQQCAGCHSRREALFSSTPPAGTPFFDAYNIALLRPDLYHADGAIKDEVYVYGSFLQSKMYEKGVSCANCHEPHSGAVKDQGNGLCTQCHSPAGNTRFPSLAKKLYDSPEHHFHEAGSQGVQCKSCHMMERTYMGVDGRRDHSFRVPRPDLSATIGVPNTCNDCHKDKSALWAQDQLRERFPRSRYQGSHFAVAFAKATVDPLEQADALLAIAADHSQAGIVRATALDRLRTVANPEIASRARALLADSDPMVRVAAVQLQRGAPQHDRPRVLESALSDKMRSVRIAAAKELVGAIPANAPAEIVARYRDANADYMASLQARADFPETHLSLGTIALGLRNVGAAQAAFREAVEQDPQLVQGWVMLAKIDLALGRQSAARDVLAQARRANPENDELRQMEKEATVKRNAN